MVDVQSSNTGSIRFMNSSFWGPCHQSAKMAGTGTAGFSDCIFVQWDRNGGGWAAIQVVGGTVVCAAANFKRAKRR